MINSVTISEIKINKENYVSKKLLNNNLKNIQAQYSNNISFRGLEELSVYNQPLRVSKSSESLENIKTKFIEDLKKEATEITIEEWELEDGQTQKFQVFKENQTETYKSYWVLNQKTNELFYAKFPKKKRLNTDRTQAEAEVFASKIYKLIGENVPEMQLIKTIDGKTGTISKYIPGLEPIKCAEPKLHSGFGVDILLANLDGIISNNVQVQNDKLYRIDFSGTFDYQADGEYKKFNIFVDELTTMLDPKNNNASAELFSSMTKNELIESLEKVANLNENELKKLAKKYSIEERLLYTILKRKEYLSYALEIIKNSKNNKKIDLDFLEEVKEKIISTPLNEIGMNIKDNNLKEKYNFISEIKAFFTKKDNDFSLLAKKLITQRNSIPEYYNFEPTNNQCLGEIKVNFGEMNRKIRSGGEYKDEQLDYIIKNSKLPKNLRLYRGCTAYDFGVDFAGIPTDKFLDYFFEEGKYFKIPIYPNTTLDKEILKERFSDVFSRGNIIFIINAPKGTNAVYMEELSNKKSYTEIGNEQEILLDKNLTYQFKKRTKYMGRDVVEIDLIQNPPKEAKIHDFNKELKTIKQAGKYNESFFS